VDNLLILSQVILSLQLGFAIIPLIHFVSDKKTMGVFAIRLPVKITAWLITAVLVYLNLKLVTEEIVTYFSEPGHLIWKIIICFSLLFLLFILFTTLFFPFLKKKKKTAVSSHLHPETVLTGIEVPEYRTVAVALEFSNMDQKLISHAIGQGSSKTHYILIHVVESASAKVLGKEADDLEARKDQEKLDYYTAQLQQRGISATGVLGFRNRAREIVRIVKENKAQMLVIGAHRHTGLKDFIYGETIESVRHELDIPVLVVSK